MKLTHGWFMVQSPHNNIKLRILNFFYHVEIITTVGILLGDILVFFLCVYVCAYIFFTKMKLNPPSPCPFWKALHITCISIFVQ